MEGWLGMTLLILGGLGWGKQVSGKGVTWPALLLMLAATGLGLILTAHALMQGKPLPLVLGAVGAVAASALMIFK